MYRFGDVVIFPRWSGQWYPLSYASEIELCCPLKARPPALFYAITQIEINEHLVADTALLRQLLEVGNGGLGHIDRDLLFEQFGVGILDAAAEVIRFSHGLEVLPGVKTIFLLI